MSRSKAVSRSRLKGCRTHSMRADWEGVRNWVSGEPSGELSGAPNGEPAAAIRGAGALLGEAPSLVY